MALTDTVGRLGASLLSIAQTRLELAAVEMEEESQRLLAYFGMVLLALILFGVAMLLVALTVVMLFWETYRVQAALGMAALFVLAAGAVLLKLRACLASKPRMLEATVGELNKDINFIRNAGSDA
ncbi:MAG: phage holin family protein [Massilia sp.]